MTSIVVVSILWKFMYQPDGLINSLLQTISFGVVQGTDWLDNPSTALAAIMFLSIWQAVGFHMIIWLSGLQTIPEELYEAARMDGAGKWQQFPNVTWPGLRHPELRARHDHDRRSQLFVQIDVMTRADHELDLDIVFYAVRKGSQQQEIGYAAAISLVFFVRCSSSR